MCFGESDATQGAQPGAVASTHESAVPPPRVRRRRPVERPQGSAEVVDLARRARAARAEMLSLREARIDELLAAAILGGHGPDDRAYWAIVYDLELAPTMTGRGMLLEQQIVPIPPQDLASDDELHDELWTVIEALAEAGVFLLHTDHLSDRDLYARLFYKILDEPTRCLPPDSGASEFIDVLHMLDVDAGGFGAQLATRLACEEVLAAEMRMDSPEEQAAYLDPPGYPELPSEEDGADGPDAAGHARAVPRTPGQRGPFNSAPMADRDRWLPYPQG